MIFTYEQMKKLKINKDGSFEAKIDMMTSFEKKKLKGLDDLYFEENEEHIIRNYEDLATD